MSVTLRICYALSHARASALYEDRTIVGSNSHLMYVARVLDKRDGGKIPDANALVWYFVSWTWE